MTKKYDKIHREIMDYILSGEMHSTLIGMMISVDSSTKSNDIKSVKQFAEYVVNLIAKAEKFAKDNVKIKATNK